MAVTRLPALFAAGLIVLGSFAAAVVVLSRFGLQSGTRGAANQSAEGLASSVPMPDSGGGTVVVTVPVGSGPYGVGYNSGNGYVYVANEGSTNVSVINGTTVVGTVPVGGAPHGVVYDSGNGYVYVANFGSDTVSVFSTIVPPLVTFTETVSLETLPLPESV